MESRQSIYNLLQQNTNLLNLLNNNKSLRNSSSTLSKTNSIIDAHRYVQSIQPNFLTLDFGNSERPQPESHVEFYGEMLYIRAYIPKGAGYMKAVQILREVYKSLHGRDVQSDSETIVRLELMNTGADLYDEAYKLDFKQATYRILKLI